MVLHSTLSNWFINHASNNAGNRNLKAFSKLLSLNDNNVTKLRQLVKDINMVILAADANKLHYDPTLPQEFRQDSNSTQKQSSLHVRDGHSGS
jgi:hypothetical protein